MDFSLYRTLTHLIKGRARTNEERRDEEEEGEGGRERGGREGGREEGREIHLPIQNLQNPLFA